ncbi:neural/ectodermal development factor IMP-L2-like [Cydia fagiglandana]|uniref:neural/ectodermal development factor IMP-L2-like n=1 Tax=Cydia fagiglandana TaxID=1458189 RepID=UPI002FEE1466
MYALIIFALVAGCRAANVNKHMRLLTELDNNIDPNLLPLRAPRRFLAITKAPAPATGHQAGTTVSLLCEAFGAPAPTIRWFKNNQPIYEYDQESNEIFDTNPTSLARISSTLLVTRTAGRDEYTCVAVAGAKTERVHSVVYSTDGSTDLIPDRARLIPLAPQILVSYKVFMDLIGNNVVLPCHAKGHPRPQVTWINNRGMTVKSDPRMKVLRSGELVISPLLWSDMGEFTCHVSNTFGSQLITTFVYPASVSRVNKVKQ